MRYAPGSVTETGTPFSWTIDTTLNQNFAGDFTTTNLTGSYVIAGLPTGGVDDGDGTASGTLTGTPSSGNITVTFTDQYGRTIVGTYAYTTAYRTQATAAGALSDQLEAINSGDQTFATAGDFTANGNTLEYSVNSVTGVSINPSTGVLTFATDSMSAQIDTAIVVTATDEYDRETTTGFNLTIATVPEAATVAMFSLADNADGTAELTISSLPGNGGQPSGFKAQYQVNGGTWNDVPSYAGTGDYTLSTDVSAGTLDIALRWVNDIGNGTASATEQVTVTGAPATITIDTLTYTRGAAGVDPTLETTVSSTGTPVANFTLFWATSASGATISKSDIENGTGSVIENGTIVAATLAGLDDSSVDLNSDVTNGEIHVFIRDANGIESAIAEETGVTYDSVAPAFSSAATNTAGTSVVITMSKDSYGSLSAVDCTVNVNGSPVSIDEVVAPGGGTEWTIALVSAIANGDTVTVSYTGPDIVGIDGEVAATFSGQSVTNNVPVPSTLTYEGIAPQDTSNASTTITLDPDSTPSLNDLLLAVIGPSALGVDGSGFVVSDTLPTGFARVLEEGGTPGTEALSVLRKIATGSEPASYSFTTFEDDAQGTIVRYSGVNTSNPINASAKNSAGSTTGGSCTAPSVTTTVDGCDILHILISNDDGRTWTPPGSETQIYSASLNNGGGLRSNSMAIFRSNQASAGAVGTKEFTCSSATAGYIAMTIAVEPA